MDEVDLQILSSDEEPRFYSLSIGFGNAHLVVRLTDRETISRMVETVLSYEPPAATWIKIGSFGPCPATLYCSKKGFSIVVDGESCGDLSNQSFAISFSLERRRELADKLHTEI